MLIWLALLCCHTTSGSTINHKHHRVICYDREPCVLIKDSFSFIPLYCVPPWNWIIQRCEVSPGLLEDEGSWVVVQGALGHLSCLACRRWRSQRSCTLSCKMVIKKPKQSWWSSLCYLLVQFLLPPSRQLVVTPSRDTRPPPFPCQPHLPERRLV